MDNIIFSEKNIEYLIKNNNMSKDLLLEQFQRKDLVSKARYIDSAGLPWGSWKEVSKSIDFFLLNQDWMFIEKDNIYNSNVAYFAPSSFIKLNLTCFFNVLNDFTKEQLNHTFSKEIVTDYIYDILINDCNWSLLERINDNVFLNLLFSFTQKDVFSKDIEKNLLEKFFSIRNKNISFLYRELLEARLHSISQDSDKILAGNDLKIALLICGQLRGFESSLPKFESKFCHLGTIDTFVSTWEEIGSTRFNLQSAYRIFDKESCDYIYENKDLLDLERFDAAIYQYKKDAFPKKIIEDTLLKNLDWTDSISISIKNDKEYPYNKMSNSEKMYYHNSFWIETLGDDVFNKYDIIIKIRPDYLFINEEPISNIQSLIESKSILVDASNYLFQEWGFGMGDQLWIGSPKNILPILKSHSRESLSYKYISKIYPNKEYLGHINCGIEAWVNGLKILNTPSSILKSKLANTDLISFDEFKKMDLKK